MAPNITANVKDFFEEGISKYHYIGLVVPLLASFLPLAFSHLPTFGEPPITRSLVYGVLTALITYALFRTPMFHEERFALHKAILLGLLVIEMTLFHLPKGVPSIGLILFFLFIYFFAVGVHKAND